LLNKQIARELGTSEVTVKVHRSQMMQKMETGSLVDLVRMAEKLAIGSPPAKSGDSHSRLVAKAAMAHSA
jgi:flavorubredoxin